MNPKHYYPTALIRFHARLIDVGQPNPDELILLEFPVLRMVVEVNHHNEADRIDVSVDFEEFPLDPRILRGVTVEAFISHQPDGPDPEFWANQTSEDLREKWAVFAGVADDIEVELDSEDGRVFRVRGRDYTAYFLDSTLRDSIKFAQGARRPSIVEVIEEVIEKLPLASALEVDAESLTGEVPVPADYKAEATDPDLGPRNPRRAETAWDAIVEMAAEAGLIVYVELDRVVLREPHTLFLRDGMDTERFLHFTLGENLKRFRPRRLLGRQSYIAVRCVSFNPRTKVLLAATKPRNLEALAARRREVGATRLLDDAERNVPSGPPKVRLFTFRGITDQAQLQKIADELYELVRYHDTECDFSTDDFEDSTGKSVLQMRFGDPIVFDAVDQFRSIMAFSVEEQVERLLAYGYPRDAAEDIARSLDSLTVPFYAHKIVHRFDSESGYSLQVEARARKQVEIGDLNPSQEAAEIEGGGP